jgi:hypothetical protein
MALNLIKVNTKTGPAYVGVTQIQAVLPKPDGCEIVVANLEGIQCVDQASVVAELCNRRPPDGN